MLDAPKYGLSPLRRAAGRVLPPTRELRGETVAIDSLTIAARFAGLSLVTWLIIILIVIVVVALLSRRRV